MKKIIVILFTIASIYLFSYKNDIVIPSDAIRFRIIANSNSIEDQNTKNMIKNDIISKVLKNIKNEKDVENNISNIENIVKSYNIDYTINYGSNYFPEKEYKGIKYPQGNYKSLVITLEDGLGENYWCVMYPQLCLVEENNTNNVEYKVLVKEILSNYKNNVN